MADHRPTADQKRRVEARARGCCEYCRSLLEFSSSPFATEHIDPAGAEGGEGLMNLAFACFGCNGSKYTKRQAPDPQTSDLVPLFNPRTQRWADHFEWNEDSTLILGLTAIGRATVTALDMNRVGTVNLRRLLAQAGLHPPEFGHHDNGAE